LKTQPDTEHYFQFFGEISLLGYWNAPESIQDPRRESTNRGGRRGAQRLINVIRAAHKSITTAGHDVQLGTPGLTNALQWSNWRSWRSWWVPMIDQLGDKVSFYGVHWYDMTPDILTIEAGIVQAAQSNRWKTRLPLCVQESDYTQGPMDDPKNGPFNAQLLWSLLDMPDKVVVNTSHVRDLGGTMFHNMFRAARRLPKYWSYWVMGDLRGTMRAVTVSEPLDRPTIASRERGGRLWLFRQDRGVRARAAGQGRRVAVLVWNDRLQGDRTTFIRFRLPQGVRATSATRRNVYFESHGKPVHETRHDEGKIAFTQRGTLVRVTLETPADSIHSIALTCNQDLATSSQEWHKEDYGSETMFRVAGPRPIRGFVANPSPSAFRQLPGSQLIIHASLKDVASARLRVALDKPRGDWEDTQVEINGVAYQVPVTEHVKRAALCEFPVRLADLGQGTVTVRFLPHHGEPYHVVWASLLTSNSGSDESVSPVTIRLKARLVARKVPASARHSERHFGIQAGDQRTLVTRVTNTSNKKLKATAGWVLPRGWRATPSGGTIELNPGETQAWQVRIQVPKQPSRVEYEQVALVLSHEAGQSIGRQAFKLNTPIPCRSFLKPPTIEAKIGGSWRWSGPDEALYGFWPQAGQTIGIDFVSDDGSVGPLTSTMYWGHGNETLHRYYVTHPREQVRGNPAAWGQLRFLD